MGGPLGGPLRPLGLDGGVVGRGTPFNNFLKSFDDLDVSEVSGASGVSGVPWAKPGSEDYELNVFLRC